MQASFVKLSDTRWKCVLGKHTYYVKQLTTPDPDRSIVGAYRVEPPESEGEPYTVMAYSEREAMGQAEPTGFTAINPRRFLSAAPGSSGQKGTCVHCGAFPGQHHAQSCMLAGRVP